VTNVYDLLVSPVAADVVLAATGRDAHRPDQSGVWRSTNGGMTWTRVHQFKRDGVVQMASCLAVAPDNPALTYAAGGASIALSTDGGLTWNEVVVAGASDSVWYVAAGRSQGAARFVYAVGSRVWYSMDGGASWFVDVQPFSLGPPADGSGPSSRSISVRPGSGNVLYVATFEPSSADPKIFEGFVWRGEFTLTSAPVWRRLPPLVRGFPGTTASGTNFVVAHLAPNGAHFLIASDRRSTQACLDEPTETADWARIEDRNCHLDPHGIALTRDFQLQLPTGPRPTNAGRVLLVNDGGANFSTDGAKTWFNGRGLSTLGIVNVAVNPRKHGGPAICMGTGDNSGFSTGDSGTTWETQDYVAGDNDCAFSDPTIPTVMVVFAPRSHQSIFLYRKVGISAVLGQVPDTSFGTSDRQTVPNPPRIADPTNTIPANREFGSSLVSHFYTVGYRPLILTVAGEDPVRDADVVVLRYTEDSAQLLRAPRLSMVTAASDWLAPGPGSTVNTVGPPAPSIEITAVQASGGHESPTYYLADIPIDGFFGQRRLWRWQEGMAGWEELVPGQAGPTPRPTDVRRFYVSPYNPNLVYVVASNHVFRSDDAGATWLIDNRLERAVTENGVFPYVSPSDGNPGQALIRDMLFDPHRPKVRFAVGPAGVFQSLDGTTWSHLLVSRALAARPNNAAYDFASCPRALYVATSNRGLLRLAPLAPDWDYPPNSVQSATGRIAVLRIHELGTGFGPPSDSIDAELIVQLDSEPGKAFGVQLRNNGDLPVAEGFLTLLQQAFKTDRIIRIEFVRSGCRTGHILRVVAQ
jgi:hypothetical protein